jgi:hypothetical protein
VTVRFGRETQTAGGSPRMSRILVRRVLGLFCNGAAFCSTLILAFVLGCRVPSVSVTGRVLNINGVPIRGAAAMVVGTTIMATTDSAGRFILDSLPDDLYGVQVRAGGYRTANCPLQGAVRTGHFRCDLWLKPDSAGPTAIGANSDTSATILPADRSAHIQTDTASFNPAGSFFPETSVAVGKPALAGGYDFTGFNLWCLGNRCQAQASLRPPRRWAPQYYSCSRTIVTPDTLDLRCADTPVGTLVIVGHFRDKRGAFSPSGEPLHSLPIEATVLVLRDNMTVWSWHGRFALEITD